MMFTNLEGRLYKKLFTYNLILATISIHSGNGLYYSVRISLMCSFSNVCSEIRITRVVLRILSTIFVLKHKSNNNSFREFPLIVQITIYFFVRTDVQSSSVS